MSSKSSRILVGSFSFMAALLTFNMSVTAFPISNEKCNISSNGFDTTLSCEGAESITIPDIEFTSVYENGEHWARPRASLIEINRASVKKYLVEFLAFRTLVELFDEPVSFDIADLNKNSALVAFRRINQGNANMEMGNLEEEPWLSLFNEITEQELSSAYKRAMDKLVVGIRKKSAELKKIEQEKKESDEAARKQIEEDLEAYRKSRPGYREPMWQCLVYYRSVTNYGIHVWTRQEKVVVTSRVHYGYGSSVEIAMKNAMSDCGYSSSCTAGPCVQTQ